MKTMSTTVKTTLPGNESISVNAEAQSSDPSTAPNISAQSVSPAGKAIGVTLTAAGVINIRFSNPS